MCGSSGIRIQVLCVSLILVINCLIRSIKGRIRRSPWRERGRWVVMAEPAPRLLFPAFFQPVLSGKTVDKVQGYQGISMSAYSLVQQENIFQVLEAEALETPIMYPGGIKRAKV